MGVFLLGGLFILKNSCYTCNIMRRKTTDTTTSTTLFELCRKNDPAAWDRLTKLYKKLVLFWLKEYKVPAKDADAVCQNVLTEMSAQFRRFRKGAPGKFRTWLRSLTYSCAQDYNQKKQPAKADAKPVDVQNISKEQNKKEKAILYRQFIAFFKNKVAPAHLNALELVTVKGMTSKVAAETLGMSGENVRQIKRRLKNRIRDEWDGLL